MGQKIWKKTPFSDWETILSEIIGGNAFGTDRMDYLLRDSHHTGVSYGKFDQFRLIDTLRILQSPGTKEPTIGVESGGLYSAEALLLARYFMFQQVYLHPVRRVYDWHLKNFLKIWLPGGKFPRDIKSILSYNDIDVLSAITQAARDSTNPAHDDAKRICQREHFKVCYALNASDFKIHPQPGRILNEALGKQFGTPNFYHDNYGGNKGGVLDFPLLSQNNEVGSAFAESKTLPVLPVPAIDFIFVNPQLREDAQRWLAKAKNSILENTPVEGEEDG